MSLNLLHSLAGVSVEWLLYSLVEGTALAVLVWFLLRLLPRRNSGTRFLVWFSVLLAIALLPLLRGLLRTGAAPASSTGTITIPGSWALAIFAGWALIATLFLARVAVGLWQVRRLRKSCVEIRPQDLGPLVREVVERFQSARPVSLCVSDRVQVPAAIGFLKPAVVVPAWFLEEMSALELGQVLVHELTHLRRRDDWTNLIQKMLKALLFFHPAVWWLDQKLSLEREMACDDAVLSQPVRPREYAECLARMAKKSFVKRLALVQAAVSRMRQLSLRVTQILDANRPASTRLWRPAIPLVVAVAAVCGFSAWRAPVLVSVVNDLPVAAASAQQQRIPFSVSPRAAETSASFVPASHDPVIGGNPVVGGSPRLQAWERRLQPVRKASPANTLGALAPVQTSHTPKSDLNPHGDYVVTQQVFFTVQTRQVGWHIDANGRSSPVMQVVRWEIWQVQILPVAQQPDKTITRKQI